MDIRLVATDMDGTLLNDRKELPADFIPWVLAHPQIQVAIASGRQYATLYRDFQAIAHRLIFIAENGSFIFHQGEMIHCDPMETESVLRTLDQLKAFPEISPIVCGAESAYMLHTDPEVEAQTAIYYAKLRFTDDLYTAAKKDRIAKIALFIPNHGAEALGKTWHCAVPGLKHTVSGRDWIDISKAATTKGSAMEAIQRRFGLSRSQCMAFGDYMNDYELLSSVEESYAMANAVDGIKAIARHLAPSNEEAGVMQILRKAFP